MKESFAREYADLEEWHWWFEGRRRIVESVLSQHIRPGASPDILSVGCGPATGLRWLIPFAEPGGTVTGLDPNPGCGASVPAGIHFVAGQLETPPLPPSSFDVVLALDVLEHLDDDDTGLEQIMRLLRPGGLLVITVPALPSLWGGQDIVSEHRRRYTRRQFRALLTRHRLAYATITYFNTMLFAPAAGIRILRRITGTANRARSDFEGSKPGMINSMLREIFGFERHLVGRVPLPIGLSLMAVHDDSSEL